jgi:plasmid stabilization system protein ParE
VKYPVRFRPEIPDDIAEACRWYEGRRAGLGGEFLGELESTLSRITSTPEIYGLGEHQVRLARTHRFPYVVYFRFTGREVVVLAVMYAGKDPSAWQARA